MDKYIQNIKKQIHIGLGKRKNWINTKRLKSKTELPINDGLAFLLEERRGMKIKILPHKFLIKVYHVNHLISTFL